MNFYDEIGRYGETPAFITESGDTISYTAVAETADRLGKHLQERRLTFLLADNCLGSVIGYLACLRSRTPVALLSASLHSELLTNLLAIYRPHYIWLPRERAEQVSNPTKLFSFSGYVLLSTGAEPCAIHEDLALLLTTSGSTGSPKFVRQSYGNITANATSIAQYLQIGCEDRPITTLPMHYVYGLSVINSHLLFGTTIILTNRSLMEKQFWEMVKAQQVTSFAGVPYTYELLKRLRFERMVLPSLNVLTQAGGKLSATLVREFAEICKDKGMRFYVMYGAAEATSRMSFLPPEFAAEKPSSVGIAIPGGEFSIEDDKGCVIDQPDVVGELIYRGENVSLGYASSRKDLALGDERGGLLRTGDMAYRDSENHYFIVGRKNRFLKIFGNRINLEELEGLIRKEGIDCVCAGTDDKLHIYIVDASRKQEVVSFVHDITRLHRSAYSIILIDQIPRNEAGKIIYAALA